MREFEKHLVMRVYPRKGLVHGIMVREEEAFFREYASSLEKTIKDVYDTPFYLTRRDGEDIRYSGASWDVLCNFQVSRYKLAQEGDTNQDRLAVYDPWIVLTPNQMDMKREADFLRAILKDSYLIHGDGPLISIQTAAEIIHVGNDVLKLLGMKLNEGCVLNEEGPLTAMEYFYNF